MATCRKCGGGLDPRLLELAYHVTCAQASVFNAWAARLAVVTGDDLKTAGQQAAADAAPDDWRDAFRAAVKALAASGRPFTSEDVTDRAGLPSGDVATNRNNAVGALMTASARAGVIVKTGRRVPSARATSHGAELTEWKGSA